LQHNYETSQTLETYIFNIGERKVGAGRFWLLGWDTAASGSVRAPPAPATLVGALGSAGEDMRHHSTCTPATMVGSAARPTMMGDGWMAREQATQLSGTQVSSTGERRRERGRAAQPAMVEGHDVAARRARGGRGWTDERGVGICFFCFERDGEMGAAPAEPRPDRSHGRTTVAYHYRFIKSCSILWCLNG